MIVSCKILDFYYLILYNFNIIWFILGVNEMSLCMACMQEKGKEKICPFCGDDGQEIRDVPSIYLPPGFLLNGRYIIGKLLGQGGFGITYIGYDTVLGTRVAVKEYFPSDMASRSAGEKHTVIPFTQTKAEYTKGRERFLEEARTLAKFADHPCIVGVKDCFNSNETAYMVMQYLDGITLKQYLVRKGGVLPAEEALGILMPIMDALRTVHKEGIIHRDVSPDNIFITIGGQVRLIDFGAARQSLGGQRSLSILLKPGYAPEEQYRTHGDQGPWTDVYAVTATLYRMVVGTVPPEALERLIEDHLQIPVNLPIFLQEALRKGLAVRPDERFSSIEQLQAALAGHKEPETEHKDVMATVSGPRPYRKSVRNSEKNQRKLSIPIMFAAGIVSLSILILAGTIIYSTSNREKEPENTIAEVTSTPLTPSTQAPAATKGNYEAHSATAAITVAPTRVPPTNPPTNPPARVPNREEDMRQLEDLIDRSMYGYTAAVSTGDTSEIDTFIDAQTAYYEDTIKYIGYFHQQGIQEEVIMYEITDVEWLDSDRCNLTQHSVIRASYASGEVKDIEETYTYLVERKNGRFYYTKMYE